MVIRDVRYDPETKQLTAQLAKQFVEGEVRDSINSSSFSHNISNASSSSSSSNDQPVHSSTSSSNSSSSGGDKRISTRNSSGTSSRLEISDLRLPFRVGDFVRITMCSETLAIHSVQQQQQPEDPTAAAWYARGNAIEASLEDIRLICASGEVFGDACPKTLAAAATVAGAAGKRGGDSGVGIAAAGGGGQAEAAAEAEACAGAGPAGISATLSSAADSAASAACAAAAAASGSGAAGGSQATAAGDRAAAASGPAAAGGGGGTTAAGDRAAAASGPAAAAGGGGAAAAAAVSGSGDGAAVTATGGGAGCSWGGSNEGPEPPHIQLTFSVVVPPGRDADALRYYVPSRCYPKELEGVNFPYAVVGRSMTEWVGVAANRELRKQVKEQGEEERGGQGGEEHRGERREEQQQQRGQGQEEQHRERGREGQERGRHVQEQVEMGEQGMEGQNRLEQRIGHQREQQEESMRGRAAGDTVLDLFEEQQRLQQQQLREGRLQWLQVLSGQGAIVLQGRQSQDPRLAAAVVRGAEGATAPPAATAATDAEIERAAAGLSQGAEASARGGGGDVNVIMSLVEQVLKVVHWRGSRCEGSDQSLDHDQVAAVMEALRGRVHLIQGPPGTGEWTKGGLGGGGWGVQFGFRG